MPTPIGHVLAGLALHSCANKDFSINNWQFGLVSLFAVVSPDLDFIPGYFVGNPNKYHHQFTHSFAFAFIVGFCLALLMSKQNRMRLKLGIYFFILICSHLGLDFVTLDRSAPYGEMLLWPFTTSYYISPFVIFSDVKRASSSGEFLPSLFNGHNLRTVFYELIILAPIWLVGLWIGRRKRRNHPESALDEKRD